MGSGAITGRDLGHVNGPFPVMAFLASVAVIGGDTGGRVIGAGPGNRLLHANVNLDALPAAGPDKAGMAGPVALPLVFPLFMFDMVPLVVLAQPFKGNRKGFDQMMVKKSQGAVGSHKVGHGSFRRLPKGGIRENRGGGENQQQKPQERQLHFMDVSMD